MRFFILSDCKFIVQPFHESPGSPDDPAPSGARGRPVTLAAMVENKYRVVSCVDECTIKVQTMVSDLERDWPGSV